ncbi:4a-hydroxytetrahydrobiopterin dehydratase [Rhodococcus sp. B10]|uniref:4a-hydroxytetrahydrobiopterin dehydratase n=1 Tax=Rhodococcus sp. B10 TaxID=2695876 RepID=UPI00142F3EAB|nr:4a-hydroxytetrahydrobiopterin dehydratase [Rhodococcus sp. B10]NIL74247.1 putative pterin-4-alpha-carbinolamine dehydratase [Rhodococcus sp. B10]
MSGDDKLSNSDIDDALTGLPGWTLDGQQIVRTVEMPTFPAAIEFVSRVADAAEAADHHPDIDIRWRKLTFRLSTHSAGGLTKKDVHLAHEINALLPDD